MARFVVVLPLSPLTVGDEFTVAQWPLHVTLVEPFETELDADVLGTALAAVAGSPGARAITVAVGDDAMFGPRRDILVSLVRDGGAIAALRAAAISALRGLGIDLVRMRQDFRPHVTAKRHGRVDRGDRLQLGSLALVRLRPPETSHHGRIVGSWPLGEGTAGGG
ncbi:2'-5' RNA ligase family protein [Agromyces sp. H3Y2-19a]|uniref:2'-5' RNA ligase family protein n=1 Tax=Agromyces TaxID=33877 RepID=UPI001E4AD0C6|nr:MULTISPECIES: 2'-5' RNA ligase family protein [Agromyces]MCD5347854.1 2'-5' RNA ligase family protein [Agromyces sp. S2-1-8]MDF0514560.1 2'-5' RNA ligase family protein [Agromyces chromiiresistens]